MTFNSVNFSTSTPGVKNGFKVQFAYLWPSWTVQRLSNNLHTFIILLIYQTFEQFEFDGCDNCEEYLHMKNNRDAVYECTSSNFDG